MEFIEGRIFEDARMPEALPEERGKLWIAAVETLALLHSMDYKAIGLETFGRTGSYYSRQMKTFSTISAAQAATKDLDTGERVGEIPHFEALVKQYTKFMPFDKSTIVHGDYKIDNMVRSFCIF